MLLRHNWVRFAHSLEEEEEGGRSLFSGFRDSPGQINTQRHKGDFIRKGVCLLKKKKKKEKLDSAFKGRKH